MIQKMASTGDKMLLFRIQHTIVSLMPQLQFEVGIGTKDFESSFGSRDF